MLTTEESQHKDEIVNLTEQVLDAKGLECDERISKLSEEKLREILEEVRKLRNRRRKRIDDKAEEDEGSAKKEVLYVRNVYADQKNLNFVVDDILNSNLKENEFDYIFDRGCFHVLLPANRQRYITKIKQILKDSGTLFLKCFSNKEPRQEGPYKFSQVEIRDLFSKYFRIDSIKETVYQGTLDPLPKALFAVMIKN